MQRYYDYVMILHELRLRICPMTRQAEPSSYLIKVRANMQAKIDDIAQKNSIEVTPKRFMIGLKHRKF